MYMMKDYTEHTQNNGAVSKVIKKCISHPTRVQRTLSAARAVQVSHVLPAVRFSCLLWGRWAVSKMALQREKAFCVLRFQVSRSVIAVQLEIRAWFKKKHYSCEVLHYIANHQELELSC
jgi:hypothetical protein